MLDTETNSSLFTYLDSCPVCQGKKLETEHTEEFPLRLPDGKNILAQAKLLRCLDCQFAFTDRLPNIPHYYDHLYSERNNEQGLENLTQQKRKRLINRQAKKMIEKRKSSGSLLDVGCGSGDFLKLMQPKFKVEGLEITDKAATYTQKRELTVHASSFMKAPLAAESYDIISFIDVLEHLQSPRENLAKANQLLKADGILYIKVPNYKMQLKKQLYLQQKKKTSLGIMYDFAHINHFTPGSLKTLLEGKSFEVVDFEFSSPILNPFLPSLTSFQLFKEYLTYRSGTSLVNFLSHITGKELGFNFSIVARKTTF